MSHPIIRVGRTIPTETDLVLPPRCVLCNQEVSDPAVPIYVRDASFTVRAMGPICVHTHFCARHLRVRSVALLIAAILGFTGSALVMAIVIVKHVHYSAVFSAMTGLAVAVAWLGMGVARVVATRGPRLHHRRRGRMYLAGFGKEFLESIPQVDAIGP